MDPLLDFGPLPSPQSEQAWSPLIFCIVSMPRGVGQPVDLGPPEVFFLPAWEFLVPLLRCQLVFFILFILSFCLM